MHNNLKALDNNWLCYSSSAPTQKCDPGASTGLMVRLCDGCLERVALCKKFLEKKIEFGDCS